MGYCPWGHKEWDTTERLSTHTYIIMLMLTLASEKSATQDGMKLLKLLYRVLVGCVGTHGKPQSWLRQLF